MRPHACLRLGRKGPQGQVQGQSSRLFLYENYASQYHAGRALADIGPVHLTVQAWSQGEPSSAAATAGAQRAVSLLGDLSRYLHTARLPVAHPGCRPSDSQPEALNRMIKAVRLLNAPDFTPMAAVAGTFSDMVKEAALGAGADRVLVNNGGDIALSVERGGQAL